MSHDIHTQLEKLKTELSKLEPAVTHLDKANESVQSLLKITDKLLPMILELQKENTKLNESSTRLVEKIEKVDFPSRFNKLEDRVSSINQGLQNTQTRISEIEGNLKDDIQTKSNEVISKAKATESSMTQVIGNFEKRAITKIEKLTKGNTLLRILLFVSIGLTAGLIALQLFKGG